MSSGRNPAGNRPETGREPAGIRPESGRNPAGRSVGRAGGRAADFIFEKKHVPGFLEHVFCGFCDF
jgi:hypothetical protein